MEHSRHQQEFWGWVGNKAESSRSGETEFPPFPQKFLPTHLFSMYPCSPAFKKRSGQKSWQLLAAGRWPCCAGLDDLAANRKAWQPLIAMLSIFQHHVGNLRNETTAVQHSSGNHQCPFHSSNSKHLGMLTVTCLTMLKTSGAVEAALHALEQPAGLPDRVWRYTKGCFLFYIGNPWRIPIPPTTRILLRPISRTYLSVWAVEAACCVGYLSFVMCSWNRGSDSTDECAGYTGSDWQGQQACYQWSFDSLF